MRSGTLIILFIALVFNAGCVAPVPLNTMGGAAGSNAPVSFNNEGGGRGESFWLAEYKDVIAATLRSGEALSLELKEKKLEDEQTFFRFEDGKGERIDLFIERRTDTMTSIKFRVGWFGSVAFGRLLARQIIYELTESESFLEDYSYETQN
jgi:hypothetical protein